MTRRTHLSTPHAQPGQVEHYRPHVLDTQRHDPYQPAGKYREPTRCPDCGAVYHHGHWQVGEAPAATHDEACPACRRMRDHLPAGVLALRGDFVTGQRAEIVRVVRNAEARERIEHCQNRVMAVVDVPGGMDVTTTDIHSPQRIGAALQRAYDGHLDVRYSHDDYGVRVTWTR